jgi:hypothetical protein
MAEEVGAQMQAMVSALRALIAKDGSDLTVTELSG